MPIIKSAKKTLRRDRTRTVINTPIRTKAKSTVKTARKTASAENLQKAFSALDRAAKKNIYHPNKVARLKSALSKRAHAAEKK